MHVNMGIRDKVDPMKTKSGLGRGGDGWIRRKRKKKLGRNAAHMQQQINIDNRKTLDTLKPAARNHEKMKSSDRLLGGKYETTQVGVQKDPLGKGLSLRGGSGVTS